MTDERDGITVRDISFASPVRGRVPAYLVLPSGSGPFPAVVWAPGSNGTRDDQLEEARDLAKRGIAGIIVTPPHVRQGGPLFVTCDPAKDLPAFTWYVKEERRAVDVLLTRPEIDGKRIGYVGFSYGSTVGAVLSAVEHRIRAFDLQSGRAHHTGYLPGICGSRLGKAKLASYVASMSRINPLNYVGHAAPSALLIQNGTLDENSPRAEVLALYRAATGQKQLRWYRSGHQLPPAANAFRDGWLEARLR